MEIKLSQITFKDIENSQKLVCDMLGVKSLHAVAGASIGGLMALEFAINYPKYVDKIISISVVIKSQLFSYYVIRTSIYIGFS